MQTVTGYLYTNWVACQLNDDPTILTRNRVVYAEPIKIYKNIDNTLKFVFKNQAQKRVHINDYELTLYIFGSSSYTANQTVQDETTAIQIGDDGQLFKIDDSEELFDAPNYGALLEVPLTILDDGVASETRGVATATIGSESISALTSDEYYYSIKAVALNQYDTVVYSDDNFGVRGTINIVDGHYPAGMSTSYNNPLVTADFEDLGTI